MKCCKHFIESIGWQVTNNTPSPICLYDVENSVFLFIGKTILFRVIKECHIKRICNS